jgi:transcription-repair coupling factor (superfamily II helicase)
VRLYKDMAAGIATAGIEYYLPLFFDRTATIFEYLGEGAVLALHGEVDEALGRFWTDTRERHRFLQHDRERPILPPEDLFLKPDEFFTLVGAHAALSLRGKEPVEWARPLPDLSVDRGAPEPLARLQRHVAETPHRVLIVAESEGRRESLLELLRDNKIEPPSVATLAEFEAGDERFAIAAAPLAEGFFWHEPADGRTIQFITETELFATSPTARRKRKQEQVSDVNALIKDLSELKVGDPVVHANHGIGRYRGLENIDLGDGPSEFLILEYADNATLKVPVATLHLISRYTGVSAEEAPLHKLGSGQWDKSATPPPSCSTSMRAAPPGKASRSASSRTTTRPSPPASASRRRPTSRRPSTRSSRTWCRRGRWTGWCAATWASARPRWRCARPSSR